MRSTTVARAVRGAISATAAAALIAGTVAPAIAAPKRPAVRRGPVIRGPVVHRGGAPVDTIRPTNQVQLSIGQGELVNLPSGATDVWVSNPSAADVYVSNANQIHLFGKAFGEATLFATGPSGAVIYSANILVSQNITSIDRMMKLAMPDANITVTTAGQLAVITGTVASPADSAQAERLIVGLLNPGVNVSAPDAQLKIGVINRLRAATPLQVNLQVRIAEVSRSFVKNIGVNLTNRDGGSNNFLFGIAQGRQGSITVAPGTPPAGYVNGAPVDANGVPIALDASGAVPGSKLFQFPSAPALGTAIGLAGRVLGTDLLASLDLGERDGQVWTLANPNITAISGETGSFLAGGEIPIPIAQGGNNGAISVEYKQYGVSLAYTPVVLADGRISLRVRPEVSQLSSQGAVQLNGTTIPGIITRRAETTVELGSGQSMMIAGLLQNTHNNSISKAPGIGDLPVVGALFRSNAFQRDETELVIVITPYLVKPVNANDIVLPTDGYKGPTDLGRVLLGQLGGGTSGGDRPKPSIAPTGSPQPSFGASAPAPVSPAPALRREPMVPSQRKSAYAAPGFSIN